MYNSVGKWFVSVEGCAVCCTVTHSSQTYVSITKDLTETLMQTSVLSLTDGSTFNSAYHVLHLGREARSAVGIS